MQDMLRLAARSVSLVMPTTVLACSSHRCLSQSAVNSPSTNNVSRLGLGFKDSNNTQTLTVQEAND